jgi:hypothetical protein
MIRFLGLACLFTIGSTAQIAVAGSIVAWGEDTYGQVSNTPTGTGFTAIAGGGYHGYALRADGSIAAWGNDYVGQVSNTPTGTGFTAIAGGGYRGYALLAEQPPTVPEPSTVVLTGLGAIAVVWRQSRRRTA